MKNPYLLCTSELASTYFPFWIAIGRKWKAKDDIYYKYPACIPFLSMFYWPNVLVSKFSKYLSLNNAFKLYAYFILGHYLLASIIAYRVLGLFGAITLTYAGYCIKPQTPAFVYTMTWIPGIFLPWPWSALSLGMAILGGYGPILVYCLPLLILNPGAIIGILIGLPQIIPFLWYWPKSVRSRQKVDRNFGKLPWWKLKDLIWPTRSVKPTNGVHYPEVEMYMGIAPLLIWHFSWWWLILFYTFLVSVGKFYSIQRIPSRVLYLMTFSITFLMSENLQSNNRLYISLIFLQAFLLLNNRAIYPSFPFSQWWDKPSRLYTKYKDKFKWPHLTGYLDGIHRTWYQGGFSLK